MKIVLDAFGGDNAPFEIVKGAVRAVNKYDDIEIVLTGKEDKIRECFKTLNYNGDRISIVNCNDVINNDDVPTEAIKTKTDSSLVKAFETLKDPSVQALISAGSTGAILTGSFLKVGRIRGISRPCLSPVLPTKTGGKVMLVDAGANVDCKPINICHFALLASTYMKSVLGIENPKVGLLNVGTEDKKGNEFTKECFALLKEMPEINFVGNLEARDALSGNYDVILADGFNGNILLKALEGAMLFAMSEIKKEIKSNFWSKFGALFMGRAFKNIKAKLNYNNYGGSPFLGVRKIVIKSHGSSDNTTILRTIEQAKKMYETKFIETVENNIPRINVEG